jgi:adenylate kinase family enzyme
MGMVANMPAMLLVGPTGSGKSPLGAFLERQTGWVHFDFGHELRAIARGAADHGLTDEEVAYVTELLHSHDLFPDEKFPIVKKILRSFMRKHGHAPGIILNGLPRHIGQAKDVGEIIEIKKVAVLNCTPGVAAERVTRRAKGLTSDHSGRSDDTHGAILKKLAAFARETMPLVDHYRGSGTDVIDVTVDTRTTENRIAAKILERF